MRAVGIVFSNIHDNNIPELVRVRSFGSIPFGGRYRLIDFPLSNMVNSGIDTVGIITKSNYQSLMDHVGSGKDWDLARKDGGLIILPPFGDTESSSLYNTRLEALKGITSFLFRADEEYVVMTDCDAVCRINYNDVLEYHIKNQADITLIYTKKAPIKGSVDYGTSFEVDETGRIVGLNYKTALDRAYYISFKSDFKTACELFNLPGFTKLIVSYWYDALISKRNGAVTHSPCKLYKCFKFVTHTPSSLE